MCCYIESTAYLRPAFDQDVFHLHLFTYIHMNIHVCTRPSFAGSMLTGIISLIHVPPHRSGKKRSSGTDTLTSILPKPSPPPLPSASYATSKRGEDKRSDTRTSLISSPSLQRYRTLAPATWPTAAPRQRPCSRRSRSPWGGRKSDDAVMRMMVMMMRMKKKMMIKSSHIFI